jgi:hypothetical protein
MSFKNMWLESRCQSVAFQPFVVLLETDTNECCCHPQCAVLRAAFENDA